MFAKFGLYEIYELRLLDAEYLVADVLFNSRSTIAVTFLSDLDHQWSTVLSGLSEAWTPTSDTAEDLIQYDPSS